MSGFQSLQVQIESLDHDGQGVARHEGKTIFVKPFVEDPETGVTVRMAKYPAGFMNTWHTHPCAHGIYVLEGTLVTHEGSFGPGNFVWFPEGMRMQHGATQTEDVTVLFITNKKFEIWHEKPAA